MKRPSRGFLVGLATLAGLAASVVGWLMLPSPPEVDSPQARLNRELAAERESSQETETVEITDYRPPKDGDDLLTDDRIEAKKTSFDPSLVDRRPYEGWSLNASDAVIRLDVPMVLPDRSPELLVLHPSYASAVRAAKGMVLPSVNMIDGKAKQFDDGLYAAIDQAYFVGHGDAMKSHLATLRRIAAKVANGSPAADYLAAGLCLGPDPVEASPKAKSLASRFLAEEVRAKPIGFYTWNKTLSECFRVLRFFARPIEDKTIAFEIARVLRDDPPLRDDYVKAYTFYARLTNPLKDKTPADLIDSPASGTIDLVTLFPPSTSREAELFEKLFPDGLPAGTDLMRELISAIRSGRVDLKPRASGGWYDHQVYAMETMLLPERADEANKLLLTKSYKKRMLDAFQALVTKRRETHVRQLQMAAGELHSRPLSIPPIRPRLRVEPNPTYYLRTARSYAFLEDFLRTALGDATLRSLRGLREGGERGMDLAAELRSMRDLFHGLALLSAEDLGFRPSLREDKAIRAAEVEAIAEAWLEGLNTDRDLEADTRVSVPVYYDPTTGLVKLWVTCGVRLTPLDARYARPPSLRPVGSTGDWKPVDADNLDPSPYLIAVDEFAEVETKHGRVFNRDELRALCDQMKTKAKIVEALRR